MVSGYADSFGFTCWGFEKCHLSSIQSGFYLLCSENHNYILKLKHQCFFPEALPQLLMVIFKPHSSDAAEVSAADFSKLQQIKLKLSAWLGSIRGKRENTVCQCIRSSNAAHHSSCSTRGLWVWLYLMPSSATTPLLTVPKIDISFLKIAFLYHCVIPQFASASTDSWLITSPYSAFCSPSSLCCWRSAVSMTCLIDVQNTNSSTERLIFLCHFCLDNNKN